MHIGAVSFDCDSTLSRIEGIDELARKAGCASGLVELTEAAMSGRLALEDVYARRLDRIRPHKADMDWLAARYREAATPGAAETIAAFHANSIPVYVVSGGLLPAILPFASTLGIAPQFVRAVDITFGADGAYTGFEASSPLARSGGKIPICRDLIARHGSLVHIGDGITDVEARASGAFVVGYGGAVRRPEVEKQADLYLPTADLRGLITMLEALPSERVSS
jgi:phosphoserine phosphatase